jgi:hypothetical protein
MIINFSCPATACFIKCYKFLWLGKSGNEKKIYQQMVTANKVICDRLKSMKYKGMNCFDIVDSRDEHCLAVIAALLNLALHFTSDSIDLQHSLSEFHR